MLRRPVSVEIDRRLRGAYCLHYQDSQVIASLQTFWIECIHFWSVHPNIFDFFFFNYEAPNYALMMEALSTSETSASFYQNYTVQRPRRQPTSYSPP
jgi:hypothetical protein